MGSAARGRKSSFQLFLKKNVVRPRLRRLGRWPVIAFRTLGLLPVDAVEQHGQFRGPQGDARLTRRGDRKGKSAFFETLVDDDEAVLVPVEQLEAVAALVAEDEEGPDGNPLSGRPLSGPLQQRWS